MTNTSEMDFHALSHLDDVQERHSDIKDLQNVFYCRLVNLVKHQNPDVDIPREKFDFYLGEYYKGIDQIFTKGKKS